MPIWLEQPVCGVRNDKIPLLELLEVRVTRVEGSRFPAKIRRLNHSRGKRRGWPYRARNANGASGTSTNCPDRATLY
jgi:hypothetical protein